MPATTTFQLGSQWSKAPSIWNQENRPFGHFGSKGPPYQFLHFIFTLSIKPFTQWQNISSDCTKGLKDRFLYISKLILWTGHVFLAHCVQRHLPHQRKWKVTLQKSTQKISPTKRNIGLHTMIHTGERPYKCSYCDKRFIQHHHRSGHERIHTGERPFKCTQCDKSLYDSANLRKNIIIHDQNKIFDCKPCDVSFARKAQLKGHNLTHHTESTEKNFPCPVCSKERNIVVIMSEAFIHVKHLSNVPCAKNLCVHNMC